MLHFPPLLNCCFPHVPLLLQQQADGSVLMGRLRVGPGILGYGSAGGGPLKSFVCPLGNFHNLLWECIWVHCLGMGLGQSGVGRRVWQGIQGYGSAGWRGQRGGWR